MKKFKVLSIFGTRPEAIKMAPLIKELEKNSKFESIVCITAQHRKMLDQVLDVFEIKPDYDLNIMQPNQTLSDITINCLKGLEKVILDCQPDIVLVHGDTTTALAGALAAFYQKVAIGHVEAGLRTFDKYSPYPEEANRQIIDRLSDMLFAPTLINKENLLKENIEESKIYVVGNTVIDAMKTTINKKYQNALINDILSDEKMILLTAHRRENLGNPMENIFNSVKKIVSEFPKVKVIYPVHLNPQIKSIAQKILGDNKQIKLIEPVDVITMHNLENKAYLILTDSGGLQEEAAALGKPVLVLRDTTERPEGVAAGILKLVGTDEQKIYEEAKKLLSDEAFYQKMQRSENPYGDGTASCKIVSSISKFLTK